MEDASYYKDQAERYRRMLQSVDDPKAREVLAGLINEASSKADLDEVKRSSVSQRGDVRRSEFLKQ